MRTVWPDGKAFAFTVVDDTDNSTVENIKPVYDLLEKLGLRTTKTTWVYPPRDGFTGGTLLDDDYLDFVSGLQKKGFEIASHNVGSGSFRRDEIVEGLRIFREKLGAEPCMHVNHASNPDNIYWGSERFQPFLRKIFELLYQDRRHYHGTDPTSTHFWGDLHKKHIKYTRNHTFNDINTLKIDPLMPYLDKGKEKYSNYWFSSSDGHTVEELNELLRKENVDRLESEGGACIVYTHFASGFVDENGEVDKTFRQNIEYLASRGGWFVPASELLDHLLAQKATAEAPLRHLARLDSKWLADRVIKKWKFKR